MGLGKIALAIWPHYFKRCDDQLFSGKLYFSSKGLVLGRGRWEVGKETQLKSGREEAQTEKRWVILGTSMPPQLRWVIQGKFQYHPKLDFVILVYINRLRAGVSKSSKNGVFHKSS